MEPPALERERFIPARAGNAPRTYARRMIGRRPAVLAQPARSGYGAPLGSPSDPWASHSRDGADARIARDRAGTDTITRVIQTDMVTTRMNILTVPYHRSFWFSYRTSISANDAGIVRSATRLATRPMQRHSNIDPDQGAMAGEE
jgi:hypothetical protein